jgi:C4-type Zn-finger protein
MICPYCKSSNLQVLVHTYDVNIPGFIGTIVSSAYECQACKKDIMSQAQMEKFMRILKTKLQGD